MIRYLSINFEDEGLQYCIKVPSEDDNLPWNLAEAFREVLRKANVNTDIVIKQLIEEFGYDKE